MDPVTRAARVELALGVCVLAVACGGEGGFSGPPDDDGNDLKPGLTTAVRVEAASSELSEALGWTGGIPAAEVRLHRLGTDFAWETATTDAQGVARFPDVIQGEYRVAAYRPLTDAEVAQVDGGARAFGDGMHVGVHEGSEATLALTPSHTGSIVFSEAYTTAPFSAEVSYDFAQFVELYNNSDQTVFLDGMLVGDMTGIGNVDAGDGACAILDRYRLDPTGIWAHFIHQFPGSGSEYPLSPGEIVVVALDAVDHSQIDPRFPDLSGADFELEGTGDPDNPNAVNLPEVGVRPHPLGHGAWRLSRPLFLAGPLDVSGLEHDVMRLGAAYADVELIKIPAAAVRDVIVRVRDNALNEQTYTRCGPWVHRRFDRLEGGFVKGGVELGLSSHRRVIGVANGRAILQDTNTSAVDLVKGPFSPGRLP